MSVPVWVLLGFAAWTLASLVATVGVYRWRRILTGRASLSEWRADQPRGDERYKRAMRAHRNCLENLPLYTVLVVALIVTGVGGVVIDRLALTILVARVCHTIVHVGFEQTDLVAGVRFAFFLIQVLCMVAMGGLIVAGAG
jgi:uncharacterized MAPEG superfamily protein